MCELETIIGEKFEETVTSEVEAAIDILDIIKFNRVSEMLSDFADVFSKAESNYFPPHRPYDHKIILESDDEKGLKYSPLYRTSLEELERVKSGLIDNLAKRFIEPSQSKFTASILFVRKAYACL